MYIAGGPLFRFDRKRSGQELRRRRKTRWGDRCAQTSSSPTLSSSSSPTLSSSTLNLIDDNVLVVNDSPCVPPPCISPSPPLISTTTKGHRLFVTPSIAVIQDNTTSHEVSTNDGFVNNSSSIPPFVSTITPGHSYTKTAGCKKRRAFPSRTELLKSAKIDVNKIITHQVSNNFPSGNVLGVFPTINFSTGISMSNKDKNKIPPTRDSKKNDSVKKKMYEKDNIDVGFSKYINEEVIAEQEFLPRYLKKDFGSNDLKFDPPIIINNNNIDNAQ